MTGHPLQSARSRWARYLARRCFSRSVRRDAWMAAHVGPVTVKEWRKL